MNLDLCITRLAANADAVMGLLQGLAPEQASWKPSPEKWSILEIINHLADEEVEDFRTRLQLTLTNPEADWPPIDPEGWVSARNYAARDLGESLSRFVDERARSAEWLRTLHLPDWSRARTHPQFGTMRAGDLLASWIEHDLIHIRQIVRLHHEFLVAATAPYEVDYAGGW